MGKPGAGSPGSASTSDIFATSGKGGMGGGGGGGGNAGQRARDEAKRRQEEKEWESAKANLGEHAPEPVEDPKDAWQRPSIARVIGVMGKAPIAR
jgi:hypothetical protein